MTLEHSLFTRVLGLPEPWEVIDIQVDHDQQQVDIHAAFKRGSRFSCPVCGAEAQAVHDTREHTWRHLNFFQYTAYLHAKLPRVKCEHCHKVSQIKAAWARVQSRFTLLFEALIILLCKAMPVNTVAKMVGETDDALWRVLDYHVEQARAQEDFSQVSEVGIDETAARRGQDYISVFHDLEAHRVLFACEGRDQETVGEFVRDLEAHGGCVHNIIAVTIDMSKAFIAGVAKYLPKAVVTFDPFHVVKLANDAVEEVRREEVKTEPVLKGSRWGWLKDAAKWTRNQLNDMHFLTRMRLKTARAWRIKEALRDIYATAVNSEQAQALFEHWYSWARRSRLEPMKRLALTLRNHLPGILNHFDSHLSNAQAEGVNSLIQAAKARARGYRTKRHLITICYLIAGNLTHLPPSPFGVKGCMLPTK